MKIAICSILKPLDDVRHFHKIAKSLAKIPEAEIHIFGRNTDYEFKINEKYIILKPVVSIKATLQERMLAPWKLLYFLIKVKPKQIISCTHELLIVITLYKILFGAKIVYDIQENYGLNIRSNTRFHPFLKSIFSRIIRAKEKLCAPFIDHFLLAERCYETELPFVQGKFTTLENKSLFFSFRTAKTFESQPTITLLFSGTIAQENGIFEAVALAIALHQIDPRYELTIVGCCHQPETARRIEELALAHKTFIQLIFSSIPLKYEVIHENVVKADIGLVCYRPQENFQNKHPTKLFEYTSAGLPIIIQENQMWRIMCKKFDNAIYTDFQNFDAIEIDQTIKNKVFYPHGNLEAKTYTWKEEEAKLLQLYMN